MNTCTLNCQPELDAHSEECIKTVPDRTFEDVTPSWATPDADNCTCYETKGKFCVMDHSIQSTVAVANTIDGCYAYLNSICPAYCRFCGSKRMWDGGGYWCPPCDDERE